MQVSRRGLVVGALAGGGLALGYLLVPRSYPLPLSPGKGEQAFNAWIRVARDGVVTVAVPQLEMGQGITTLIPQIVAIELGADWRQIAVEPAPVNALYANFPLAARWAEMWMGAASGLADSPVSPLTRRWAEDNRFMATADGMALEAYEQPVREAAAAVRALLAQAAAARWNVGWEACEAAGGFITHGKRRLSFGELAADAAKLDPPDPPVLRAGAARERPIENPEGAQQQFPRLDLPAKVDGSYLFAGDVRLPGMVYAAIRHGPIGESTLARYDKSKVKGIGGFQMLVRHERWLAAVASDWWSAERALAALAPTFDARLPADSSKIEGVLDKELRTGSATRIAETGNAAQMDSGPFALALRYDVAPALHAGVETASATARLGDDKLELWLATQSPAEARRAAARAIGMTESRVVLYPMPAGGSFDARLEHDHAVQAALIARECGKPVQLMWSRWQEQLASRPRPPVTAVMTAKVAQGGAVIGWKARLAMPSTSHEFARRHFAGARPAAAIADSHGEADWLAMEGAVPPYAIPDMAVEHVPARITLPTGRLRGNGHGYTAFFNESFVDELAHRAKLEPLAFRIAMLGHDARLVECLQRVSTLATWNGGVELSGQGLACHVIRQGSREGRIAVVATARRNESGVRVERISAVADIGRIINVDIARQQIEGGLIFGIGLALGSSTSYSEGLPTTSRLAGLGLPLLADCPEIDVEFIDSEAPPADPGELGVAAVAPAIANALFSATGLRFRRLPLLSEGL